MPKVMDEELRLEIIKICSLAHEPEILPDVNPTQLSLPGTSKDSDEPKTPKKRGKAVKKPAVKKPAEPPPTQLPKKPLIFPTLSKKNRKYLGMKASELHFRIHGDKVVEFCQEHEMIAKKVICSCGNLMRFGPKTVNGGYEWTCFNKSHPVKPHQTIQKGTWLEDAALPLADVLWIAYMWVHEYSPTSMLHECGYSNKILLDWCEICLDMCREILEHKRDPVGGEGRSVEIFECKITKNKKPTDRWAFCGIEQYSINSLELLLENKKSYTLLQIFDKYFLPGTKVVTHNWNPYKNLSQGDFMYLINKKSLVLYDVVTNKNMEVFPDFKRATNRPPRGLNKWSKLEYGPSFFEKMYRKSLAFSPDAFLTYLHDIAMVHKPLERFIKVEKSD